MILSVHNLLRSQVAATIIKVYGLKPSAVPAIAIQNPPTRRMGDLAITVSFELARVLHKAPKIIAQEIISALDSIDGIATVEAAPNGYLNFFLDRPRFLSTQLTKPEKQSLPRQSQTIKTIVEHTSINPNKAAHIGHLRNSVLGDTLGRLLRFQGCTVEIQNYIDDTGVQVADMVVGFQILESKDTEAVQALATSSDFDYLCWDLYTKVTEWYDADSKRLETRTATLRAIEAGNNDTAAIAHIIANRIVQCHLRTMERLNINYDLLAWEGDILRLKFWEQAFKILKESGAVFLQDSGKLAGCWVMRIDPRSEEVTNINEETANNDKSSDDEHREKVIVRSNGLVTYVGKDIAYQFWKFGLLGKNFHYQIFDHSQKGKPVWTTTSTRSELTFPEFGKADAVYNVIDTRQSYLQELLKQALQIMGHPSQAESSVHFSYEMVALSNHTAQKLGYTTSINPDRSFVEVSGRKGVGVKADDLINRMTEVASVEVTKRNADLGSQECEHIAKMIAVAAVRYFMIKYSRGKVIIFDIDDALSFEGESGPYLQYAVVRANKILQKLKEQTGTAESDVILKLGSTPTTCLNRNTGDELWTLILECARLDEVVNQAIRTHELSGLAKYAFSLAQTFNAFYHREPILKESKMDVQLWRAATVIYFRTQMTRTLDLMGCQVPPRM